MDEPVARILDANANRCGEALRVLEEHARFVLGEPHLTLRIKEARHDLATMIAALPLEQLRSARDVEGDVGTDLSTPTEARRESTADVAAAAARRAAESLRCLEEYAKLADAGPAAGFEKLRYRVYEIEQDMLVTPVRGRRLQSARLHVLLTEALCRRPWLDVAAAAIDGGAEVLQLREKMLPDRELLERAERLRRLTHSRGALLIINDRPDIARIIGADGVHVGQDDLPVAAARRVLGAGRVVGRSTHSIEQVRAALADRPDYLAVGPMFPSPTKPADHVPGPSFAAAAVQESHLPLVAIGGITPPGARMLREVGVRRVAVSQFVIADESPRRRCEELRAALDSPSG